MLGELLILVKSIIIFLCVSGESVFFCVVIVYYYVNWIRVSDIFLFESIVRGFWGMGWDGMEELVESIMGFIKIN